MNYLIYLFMKIQWSISYEKKKISLFYCFINDCVEDLKCSNYYDEGFIVSYYCWGHVSKRLIYEIEYHIREHI